MERSGQIHPSKSVFIRVSDCEETGANKSSSRLKTENSWVGEGKSSNTKYGVKGMKEKQN